MGALLTTDSVLMCPHLGTVVATPTSVRVRASGSPILCASDSFIITGCQFNPVPPHPCVSVSWLAADLRSTAVGDSTLSDSSIGMCIAGDQTPQGFVQVLQTQERASGQ